jgi:hypothetical protein
MAHPEVVELFFRGRTGTSLSVCITCEQRRSVYQFLAPTLAESGLSFHWATDGGSVGPVYDKRVSRPLASYPAVPSSTCC